MKISKVHIKGFQSHVDTEIEFGSGLNTILGSTDSGKSSIIRAICSTLFKDKFYLRSGETNGYVSITFQDGSTFSRIKQIKDGVTTDKFIFNGTTYRKIGKVIPKEILEGIKVRPIELNDGSMVNLHLQTQHGGKFLLSDSEYSAGFRARVTSLSGSETLDRASLAASSEHRAVKSSLTVATDKALPALNKSISIKQSFLDINDSYKDLRTKQDSVSSRSNAVDRIKELKDKLQKVINTKPSNYYNIVDRIKSSINNLNALRLLNDLRDNCKPVLVPELPTIDRIVEISNLLNKVRTLYTVYRESNDLGMSNYSSRGLLSGWSQQYQKFMDGLEKCPLCERSNKE